MQKMIPAEDVYVHRVGSVGEFHDRVFASVPLPDDGQARIPEDGQGPVLASIRQMIPGIRPVPTIRQAVGL